MFNCLELEDYLKTPIKKRSADERNEAYRKSYQMLIDWWKGCSKRNYDTPILGNTIDMEATIKSLEEKRDSFK